MVVRHMTSADNVDGDWFLVDPSRSHHGTIQAGHVEDLSGAIDPLTHLNRDFPDHDLGECVVAARLERGAEILVGPDGQFRRARPRRTDMAALGKVDIGARRVAWLAAHQASREDRGRVRG